MTADMHYYGPPSSRFPSREAWRDCEQDWETPRGPNPSPSLRLSDGIDHPVTIRQASASDLAPGRGGRIMSRPEFRKCPQRHPVSGVPCDRLNSHRGHEGDHLTFDGATWDTWRICGCPHPDHPLVSCALPWGHTGAHESATGRIIWAATL